MTDFEENIKRGEACGLTQEKFNYIRDDAEYGDDEIYRSKFGHIASWLTWNRDETGNIASVKTEDKRLINFNSFYDGPISEWNNALAAKLTTNIVFVGLNMSSDDPPDTTYYFQNARGVPRIVRTFFGTEAEGGYFTDIIKQDKRIIEFIKNKAKKSSNRGKNASSENNIKNCLEHNLNYMEDHLKIFKLELDILNKNTAERPLLIVFGNTAGWILEHGINNGIIKKGIDFKEIVKIWHYSKETRKLLVEYIHNTRTKLKKYITIPSPTKNIDNINELKNDCFLVDSDGRLCKFICAERQEDRNEYIRIEYNNKIISLQAGDIDLFKQFINRDGLPLPSLDKLKEPVENIEINEILSFYINNGMQMNGPDDEIIVKSVKNKGEIKNKNLKKGQYIYKNNNLFEFKIVLFNDKLSPKDDRRFVFRCETYNSLGIEMLKNNSEIIKKLYPKLEIYQNRIVGIGLDPREETFDLIEDLLGILEN